jgi:dsDNA-specific endonuclease/ATPase MutS2
MAERLFDDERNLFRKRINELMGKGTSRENVDSIIKAQLSVRGSSNEKKLVKIYDLLGIDTFFDLLDITEDDFVQFPSIASLSDTIQAAIAFHDAATTGKEVKLERYVVDEATNVNKLRNLVNALRECVDESTNILELENFLRERRPTK